MGTYETVVEHHTSHTDRYLKQVLEQQWGQFSSFSHRITMPPLASTKLEDLSPAFTLSQQGPAHPIRLNVATTMNEMGPMNSVESFIELARQDQDLKSRLADCSIEKWGSEHLPLDVDLEKVLSIAHDYGFSFTRHDIIQSQCRKLAEFWQFEMGNAFVARRTLDHIQYQLAPDLSDIDYYEY